MPISVDFQQRPFFMCIILEINRAVANPGVICDNAARTFILFDTVDTLARFELNPKIKKDHETLIYKGFAVFFW